MSDPVDLQAKQRELAALKERVEELEAAVSPAAKPAANWPPKTFYSMYYFHAGMVLGSIAAAASLLVNVIGAPLAGKSPMELIRVYLTFPLGERALIMGSNSNALQMALGCCLYLLTGMVLGVPLYWLMVRFCGESAPLGKRLMVASILSLGTWLVSFYGILSWLQPMLFGGKWITDPAILPPWVAAGTHLIFGWVIALLHPWGQFTPYRNFTPSS